MPGLTTDQLETKLKWTWWIMGFVIALLIGACSVLWYRHATLLSWARGTDTPQANYTAGQLTSYLSDMAEKLQHHIEQQPEQAHGHPDSHLEPPPPPGW